MKIQDMLGKSTANSWFTAFLLCDKEQSRSQPNNVREMWFDSDSMLLLVDNGASASITSTVTDFIDTLKTVRNGVNAQPALDLDVIESYGASCGLQLPAKSESTQHSKLDTVSSFRIKPLSLVPLR